LLHIYFALRKQQSFHRLLNHGPGKQAAVSTSGKSWKRPAPLSSGIALEINALDTLGRTVLHLACTSTESSSLEYVRMLLAHPATNVNVLDKESHWTPLHRALYAGNVSAAYACIFAPLTGSPLPYIPNSRILLQIPIHPSMILKGIPLMISVTRL